MKMRYIPLIAVAMAMTLTACAGSDSPFIGWQTEELGAAKITESQTKSFIVGAVSNDSEQRIRALAFDRGSNTVGHFKIDKVVVGDQQVSPSDIIIPPGSSLNVTVTYSPLNLKTTPANWGGWVTGDTERWIPKSPEEASNKETETVYHRSIIEAVYDYPSGGICYVQLVGEAKAGPNGETESKGGAASCTAGGGVACYTGSFALDIPKLAPGGPKTLKLTGPITFKISGSSASLRMDDFPFVIYVLKSEEVPQLPSGVTATLVISGAQGKEATGSFDGSRLSLKGVAFRIRIALGELTSDQISQGMSSLVDFTISDLEIKTIKPLSQGAITLHLETTLSQNPSGNTLFDQFLSGAKVTAVMDGKLAF